MALYETLFVVHPERATRMKEFIDKFKKVVETQDGVVSQIDEWGLRDLEDVTRVANAHGLQRQQVVRMPANNLTVIFAKSL